MEMVIIIHMDDKNPNMKNIIRLGGNYIKMNINDSKCFVAYPNLEYYKILGYGLKEENDEKKSQKIFQMKTRLKSPIIHYTCFKKRKFIKSKARYGYK